MASSSNPLNQVVHFGEFTVELQAGELFRDGSKVKLRGQPFEILVVLLEQPGQLVTREELRRRLWPSDTFVDFEHGLNAAVNRLREALSDSADQPRFIETIPRRGYRFIAPVDGIALVPAKPRAFRWVGIGVLAALGLLAATVALNIGGSRERIFGSHKTPIRSVAVLPLANLSSDPEQEYFAEGMTEALITELGKISALRVISRQSMMQYKGTKKSAPQIARELNVEAVVEGSVLRAADRVRISLQLIQAAPERHLWASSYDRDLRDVLALHSEMARTVAGQVRVKLRPEERALLAGAPPVNPEAYDSYLHGARLLSDESTADSARRAVPHFERAISLDTSSALPYCGLANAYLLRGHLAALGPREAFPVAKAAALKAQELDDNVACAHWALAEVHFLYDWDWAAAEKEYHRAIELNPGNAELYNGYAHFLKDQGRGRDDEAFAELRRALELDPTVTMARIGFFFYFARQYDEVIQRDLKFLEATPNFSLTHLSLGLAYEQKKDFSRAIPELKRAVELSGDKVFPAYLAHAYAVSGKAREAKRILEELKQPSGRSYVDPWAIALVYAGLGEKDRAMEWLEKAYRNRDHDMAYCKVWPQFDPLRSDPRFQDLLRRMNFPPDTPQSPQSQ
jgi:TolB-like protein/DNA-binding winged helix-turn-helix (wHTH) protein/Flp pilus assembly protein TadD